MMPARLAIAMQDDGWVLRSDIIWHKLNPMPESVTDRPTTAHEHVFLFAKRPSYFFDADAVREPSEGLPQRRLTPKRIGSGPYQQNAVYLSDEPVMQVDPLGRNLRDVWSLASEGFSGAHFATFHTEIPRRAIAAGTSEHGCCAECGAPWQRHTTQTFQPINATNPAARLKGLDESNRWNGFPRGVTNSETIGWEPTCTHDAPVVPCVVLDPFSGSGTTGVVALRLGRRYIGLELNSAYCAMARDRIENDAPMLNRESEPEPASAQQEMAL